MPKSHDINYLVSICCRSYCEDSSVCYLCIKQKLDRSEAIIVTTLQKIRLLL